MSELSRKLLSTNHKGVHEQFDFVYAATLAYQSLHLGNDPLGTSLRTHHKKIIKAAIKNAMNEIGFKLGFLNSGLSYYAYEFWEIIVNSTLDLSTEKEAVPSLSDSFLTQLAGYLDDQFRNQGRADSIEFLKARLP